MNKWEQRDRKKQSAYMKKKLGTGRKQIWLLMASIGKSVKKVLGKEQT